MVRGTATAAVAAATATTAAALALARLGAASPVGACAVSASVTAYRWAAAAAAAWLGCELLFFLHVRRLHRRLDRITPPPRVPSDPEAYLARSLDVLDTVPFPIENFFCLWCGSRSLADLRWGNVRNFIAWAIFGRSEQDLTPPQLAALGRMTADLRRRYGQRLALGEGTNAALLPMTMTLQPMEVYHRPLIVYLLITFIPAACVRLFLRAVGFRCHVLPNGEAYWHRPGSEVKAKAGKEEPARLPLIFFHGVGGLLLYAPLVWRLAKDRAGPTVLVEIPHVEPSLRSFAGKGPEEVVAAVETICARHGIEEFCAAGHSYGTIVAGWVIKGLRHRVKQAVLLGPVAFLLFLPNTNYGFLYRPPHEPTMDHHLRHEALRAPAPGAGVGVVSVAAVAAAAAAAAAKGSGAVTVPSTEMSGTSNGNGTKQRHHHQARTTTTTAAAAMLLPPVPPRHRPLTLLERARHWAVNCILHYIISRELTVANAMRRQFWWYEKMLWADDIHCPLVCGMGSCDQLLAVPAIVHHVRTHHPKPAEVELILWDGCCHGEFLLAPCLHGPIAKAIHRQEKALGLASPSPSPLS